jgi:Ca-activated chloride channel family protein
MTMISRTVAAVLAGALIALSIGADVGAVAGSDRGQTPQGKPTPGFSFRTSVDLINVTATVTDAQGRFVPGLRVEDFEVYEDGKLQKISQFDSERVPVSLGIVMDTSGSMAGEKMSAAQDAVRRFLDELLGPQDEVFLMRFDSQVSVLSHWTENRAAVSRMVGSIRPAGGTALYDAVSDAIPLGEQGTRRKKALVLLSDGNDQNSRTDVDTVQQQIRESELLVYAIGIDTQGETLSQAIPRIILNWPRPGSGSSRLPAGRSSVGDRLNVGVLRSITDDSGGRTEIVRNARDLDAATAGIASELSRQYFLGYSTSSPRDGRWHTIELRLKRGNYTVRARKGFIAESAQGAERGEGAPRATEPGGVQGTPAIRAGGVQGTPPIREGAY